MSLRTRRGRLSLLRRHVALVVGTFLTLSGSADAQQTADRPYRWQLELVGGLTGITASDLNSVVDYETVVVDHLRTQQVQQSHEGALMRLRRAFPFGGRVVRRLGEHWSAGAGFTFFTTEQRSAAKASYRYTVVDPRAQEFQREFSESITVDPVLLRVREYLPHLLARYDRPLGRRLKIGASLHAGWLFADCRLERSHTIAGGFYPVKRMTSVEMTGQGSHIAGSVWLSAHLSLTRRLGLLVEGGRTWHEVKTVTGSGKSTLVAQDGEATETELTQTWQGDGRWTNQPVTYQSSAGQWQGTIPAIGGQGRPFSLYLSGWQVKLGVSFGL
jgi:hypothetical protein